MAPDNTEPGYKWTSYKSVNGETGNLTKLTYAVFATTYTVQSPHFRISKQQLLPTIKQQQFFHNHQQTEFLKFNYYYQWSNGLEFNSAFSTIKIMLCP